MRPALLLIGTLLALTGRLQAEPALFSADGYRIEHYRSPTPAQHQHARPLDTPALQRLLLEQPHARLIDVYRRPWRHGQFVADEAHANLWLASHGDKAWPLVFYCRADCWLGWNAVKRAHALGYNNLYWYRKGIDAWQQAGLPLVPAQPAALP